MALIKCTECGKKISDTIKKCPNCGYTNKKRLSKKMIIILVIMSLILLIGSFLVIKISRDNHIKQQEKLIQEYDDLIVETGAKIYLNGFLPQYYSSKIANVWYECIKATYCNDFNSKISEFMRLSKKGLATIEEKKSEIEKNMQKLKNVPTSDYKDVYEKIAEFYNYYSKLVECATNPSGNYTNYISNYNNYISEFNSTYNQLIILKPEIKDYKETTSNQ